MNQQEISRIELLTVLEKMKLSLFPFLGSVIVLTWIQQNPSLIIWAFVLFGFRALVQFVYQWGETSLDNIQNVKKVENTLKFTSFFMGCCWAVSPFLFSELNNDLLTTSAIFAALITIISIFSIMSLPRIDFFILFLIPLLCRIYYQLFHYHTQNMPVLDLFMGVNLFVVTQIVLSFKLRDIYQNQIHLKIKNEDLALSLSKSEEELKQMVSLYKSLSLHDELTSLPNRRYLQNAFNQYKSSTEAAAKYALMVVDLDHFKRVNDRYGHQTGDLVLKEVSELLKNNIRKNDVVARVGGEEFVILLPNIQETELLVVSERLRRAIENRQFNVNNEDFTITVSIGISLNTLKLEMEESFELADQAVYQAKRNGRNQIVYSGKEELPILKPISLLG